MVKSGQNGQKLGKILEKRYNIAKKKSMKIKLGDNGQNLREKPKNCQKETDIVKQRQ